MIIKRRLYSSSPTPEEQIERLKNMSPGMKGLSAGIMGIAGATPGILLKSGKLAAIGGALGASAGLYLTSKGFRERQIRKLEKEIEGKKKLSQSYIDRIKADRQKELQKIKEDYGSILPREFYILYKLSIELDEPSVGDGDEYCAVRCSDYDGIWKELEESDNQYIDYLVGSSTQGKWYTWNVEKKCWFDDRGKRVFNFKQRFIKDFQDNLKEVQGPGKLRSGYDTWEQWERDEVAEYLKNVIKELQRKL